MCCCDYDPAEFSASTTRRARKPHRCIECDGTIAPGQRYVRLVQKWDGRMCVSVSCLDCDAWAQGLMTAQGADASSDCVGYCLGELWTCIGEYVRGRYFALYRDEDDDDGEEEAA